MQVTYLISTFYCWSLIQNERVNPGTPWLAASTTMNVNSGPPDARHIPPASPPGKPMFSNLYPTHSSILPHNGHFEPLHASMSSPRALNVAPVETENFLTQLARQVQPHFSNNSSSSSFPQGHTYNAYPTPDYRNYFITLPHESSRDFGFSFNPYRPHPGTRYPLPHNNYAFHNNIFPYGHLFPQSNPMHNFQQQYRPPGFLPIEYGHTGTIHRSFYPSPPHILSSPPIMNQTTLRGNGATFVTSDRNVQVRLIVSSWVFSWVLRIPWIYRSSTIPPAVLTFLDIFPQTTPPELKQTNPRLDSIQANLLQVEGVAKVVASIISRLQLAAHCLKSSGRTGINAGLSWWIFAFFFLLDTHLHL